jgi:hypothetical protein
MKHEHYNVQRSGLNLNILIIEIDLDVFIQFKIIWTKTEIFCFDMETSELNLNVLFQYKTSGLNLNVFVKTFGHNLNIFGAI